MIFYQPLFKCINICKSLTFASGGGSRYMTDSSKGIYCIVTQNKYTQVQLATPRTTQSVNKYSVIKYHA